MTGRPENLWWTILVNIPACLLLGICDFLLVKKTQQMVKRNVIRVITDLMVTTIITIVIICGLNRCNITSSLKIRSAGYTMELDSNSDYRTFFLQ